MKCAYCGMDRLRAQHLGLDTCSPPYPDRLHLWTAQDGAKSRTTPIQRVFTADLDPEMGQPHYAIINGRRFDPASEAAPSLGTARSVDLSGATREVANSRVRRRSEVRAGEGPMSADRLAIAQIIAEQCFAFMGEAEFGSERYDCGDNWDELGILAQRVYLSAADDVLAQWPVPATTSPLLDAAPDLLAALEGAMVILSTAESNASGNPDWNHVGPRVAAARAAIAKAKGL